MKSEGDREKVKEGRKGEKKERFRRSEEDRYSE